MSLYGVLDAIKAKPEMFEVDSVDVVFYIIFGYRKALSENKISDSNLEHFNEGFLNFVRKSFPDCPAHASWKSLILLYSTSRAESLRIFFALLDRYRLSTGLELTDPSSKFIRLSMDDMPKS
jgi:hypothetical protein